MYEQQEDQNHELLLSKMVDNYSSPFAHQIILEKIIKVGS
jgi:hypothetical protein